MLHSVNGISLCIYQLKEGQVLGLGCRTARDRAVVVPSNLQSILQPRPVERVIGHVFTWKAERSVSRCQRGWPVCQTGEKNPDRDTNGDEEADNADNTGHTGQSQFSPFALPNGHGGITTEATVVHVDYKSVSAAGRAAAGDRGQVQLLRGHLLTLATTQTDLRYISD